MYYWCFPEVEFRVVLFFISWKDRGGIDWCFF